MAAVLNLLVPSEEGWRWYCKASLGRVGGGRSADVETSPPSRCSNSRTENGVSPWSIPLLHLMLDFHKCYDRGTNLRYFGVTGQNAKAVI
jgi:hypothetical protein